MDILLSAKVFQKYFDSLTSTNKDEITNDLIALINNQNNKLVISKELIEILEETNANRQSIQNFIGPFLANLINNGSRLKIDNQNVSNLTEQLKASFDNNSILKKKDVFLVIGLRTDFDHIEFNSIVYDEIKKPDKTWIFYKLACYHPMSITLRYYDFNSDLQIKKIFQEIISIVHQKTQVDIFDRHVNLEHMLFDEFKNNILVHYYTIDNSFKTSSEKIYKNFKRVKIFTGKSNDIHERRILVRNLIIESDDDFSNLEISRSTWKVDLTYCNVVSSQINAKKNKFIYRKQN